MSININNIWIAWRAKINDDLHKKIDAWLRSQALARIENQVFIKACITVSAVWKEIDSKIFD